MEESLNIRCSVFSIPDKSHPNKSPFSGILCNIDNSSMKVPHGSGNRKVVLTREGTQKALPSIINTPVNVRYDGEDEENNFTGHDTHEVVGQITNAYIEGNDVWVEGYLYQENFPEICAAIKASISDLGFSYEIIPVKYTVGENTMTLDEFIFSGACILYKDNAAYGDNTQLIAASKKGDKEMAEEKNKVEEKVAKPIESPDFKAIVAEAIKGSMEDIQKSIKDLSDNFAKDLKDVNDKVTAIEASAKPEKKEEPKEPEFDENATYKFDKETNKFIKIEAAKEEKKAPEPKTEPVGKSIQANEDLASDNPVAKEEKEKIWASTGMTPYDKLKAVAKLKAKKQ